MKQLTLRDLFNKVLNFNLYSLQKHIRRLSVIAAVLFVLAGLLCVGLYIKDEHDKNVIRQAEVDALARAKESHAQASRCFERLKQNKYSRDDLEFYLFFDSCIKGRNLTPHEIKVLKSNWSDSFTRVINFLDSAYYKLGSPPQKCTYNGFKMIECNNGNSYPVDL
ncbi:hypothetical protein MD588_24085 [Photobacterium sp. SDRW27]|uniref:hypothetical protein n=1 Tax=Photobacterium obscurum TaxID=2829490 RepID=UPI002244C025|nr:hypothetical protein [Photobacterium obscurum]MCW8331884.1 hypothetical protein [Photobacterium obscurum]